MVIVAPKLSDMLAAVCFFHRVYVCERARRRLCSHSLDVSLVCLCVCGCGCLCVCLSVSQLSYTVNAVGT